MDCLPDSLKGRQYFHPQESGEEHDLKQRLEEIARKKNRKE
jgi:putative ATPase